MRQLAAEGLDFSLVDYRGRGPIHITAISGDLEILDFLIEQRVNLDFVDQLGMSALYLACYHKNRQIVERMYAKGATVIVPNNRIDKQLCQAGYDNDLEFIKLLNLCEANLNIANYDKRTVGHLAACENHREMLIYLASETNFNFFAKDRFGKTALEEVKDKEFQRELLHHIQINKKQLIMNKIAMEVQRLVREHNIKMKSNFSAI